MSAPDVPVGQPSAVLFEETPGPRHLLPLRAMQRPVALLLAEGDENVGRANALSVLAEMARCASRISR